MIHMEHYDRLKPEELKKILTMFREKLSQIEITDESDKKALMDTIRKMNDDTYKDIKEQNDHRVFIPPKWADEISEEESEETDSNKNI